MLDIAAIGLGLLVPAGAGANAFGPMFADSADHSLCTTSTARVNSSALAAVGWARQQLDSTDMSAYMVNCTAATDVRYFVANTGSTQIAGTWRSTQLASARICDQGDVTFNTRLLGNRPADIWRAVGCHETGHSVGLGHSDNSSCMGPASPNRYLSPHDRGHINGRW